MPSTPWTKTLSDLFYQLVIPAIIDFPKMFLVFFIFPTLLLLFFGLRFYRIPRRLWIKKFRNKDEVEKLQEFLAISRQYSEATEIREWILEQISPRLTSKKLQVDFFGPFNPPAVSGNMNRAQFIEDRFRRKRKELREIFSEKEIRAFS